MPGPQVGQVPVQHFKHPAVGVHVHVGVGIGVVVVVIIAVVVVDAVDEGDGGPERRQQERQDQKWREN